MDSPAPNEVAVKSISVKSAMESEVRNLVEQGRTKPAQAAHTKIEMWMDAGRVDAGRIRSSIARLTSNSTNELEKLISELEALQEFLKAETDRVQGEIESVLEGIKIIVEAISPWKTACVAGEQNNTRPNGRDRIKHWL